MTHRSAGDHSRDPGPTLTRRVAAPPSAAWAAVADGWSYAAWVVGTCRVRDVDDNWPAVGARIHHSFGVWPLVISDVTRVERVVPGSELVLTARGWPLGEARVHLSFGPDGPDGSLVTMTEDASAGPGRFVPASVRRLLLVPRNRESLYRLGVLVEGRHRKAASGDHPA